MVDDLSDPYAEDRRIRKANERKVAGGNGGGDSSHSGSGEDSVQLGPEATASGDSSTAVGYAAYATAREAAAFGYNALASGEDATAVGSSATVEYDNSAAFGKNAQATMAWQVMLGSPSHTVATWNAISVLSARRLKHRIVEAPVLRSIFPDLFEWEYIADESGRRHIGPMADDLVGTDGERFVIFDDAGQVAGIATQELHAAQIYALLGMVAELRAELDAVKNELRG